MKNSNEEKSFGQDDAGNNRDHENRGSHRPIENMDPEQQRELARFSGEGAHGVTDDEFDENGSGRLRKTSRNENQANQGQEDEKPKKSGTSRRGFASMDPAAVREIASRGGRAAHESGNAHEFTSAEARKAARERWK